MLKKVSAVLIMTCFLFTFSTLSDASSFGPNTTDDPERKWTISFNDEVLFTSSINQSIYIKNELGEHHPVSYSLSDDLTKVIVKPEKPYMIGQTYSLIVSETVSSKKGTKLKSDVTMDFSLKGTHILDVKASLNPFLRNVTVQSVKDVKTMKVSINGSAEQTMHQSRNNQFKHGLQGLVNGDSLLLKAYDINGRLVEQQTYLVTN